MTTTIWVSIGIIFVIVWSIIIWGVYKAPMMPDDYGITEEDLNLKNEKTKNKKFNT